MPLTKKGEKIMANMASEYGPEKGKRVFYASRNAGKITGVDPESSHRSRKRHTQNASGSGKGPRASGR
jgi:hypothetical protein